MVKYWQRYSAVNLYHVCTVDQMSTRPQRTVYSTAESERYFSDINLPISVAATSHPKPRPRAKRRKREKKKVEYCPEERKEPKKCAMETTEGEDSPLMVEFFKEIQTRELKNYYAKKIAANQYEYTCNQCPTCGWMKPPVCEDL